MSKLVQKTISMPCHPRFLNEARTAMTEGLVGVPIPRREKELLVLAVDEVAGAIVHYAREKGTPHEVSLSIDIDEVRLKVTFIDSLNVFDLSPALGEPQLAERVAQERAHGLCLFLVRRIMDEITYTYRKGFQNEMELIKFL